MRVGQMEQSHGGGGYMYEELSALPDERRAIAQAKLESLCKLRSHNKNSPAPYAQTPASYSQPLPLGAYGNQQWSFPVPQLPTMNETVAPQQQSYSQQSYSQQSYSQQPPSFCQSSVSGELRIGPQLCSATPDKCRRVPALGGSLQY
jgi:hypothetical protein